MRFMAFLAGLAGLVVLVAEGVVIAIAFVFKDMGDYLPMAASVTTWGQFAFIILMTLFLFLFALSKRTA